MPPTFAQTLEAFRAAGPRSVHTHATTLAALLRADPSLADGLPPPADLPDPVQRRYVTRWRATALADLADTHRLSEFLADTEPALRANALHDLGNRRPAPDHPWLPIVAAHLGDASPEVVASALYVFARHAIPDRDLAIVLDAIVLLLADARRADKKKLADTARATLDVRFAAADDVAPYFAAIARASDPTIAKRAKAVATAWKAREADPVIAASRRLRAGAVDERIAAAKTLAHLLAIDVVDIRASFVAISDALAHPDAAVREAAAELAVLACEAQGGVDEILVLARPVADARDDAAPAVRDAASRAVAFLDAHRERRGLSPLG